MSYISRGLVGLIVVGTTVGAIQAALGQQTLSRQAIAIDAATQVRQSHEAIAKANGDLSSVNRDTKTDRSAVQGAGPRSQTLSIRVEGMDQTSVLVRVLAAAASTEAKRTPLLQPAASQRRAPVACEAMVSALSEVARQLQPGRCVT